MFDYSLVINARTEAKKAIARGDYLDYNAEENGLCANFFKALKKATMVATVEDDRRALRQLAACDAAVKSGDKARIYCEPVSSERQKIALAALAAKAKSCKKNGTVLAE